MCQVVRSGGNVHGEAPLKTGVALSAVHAREAGAGTVHYFARRRRRFTLTPLFLPSSNQVLRSVRADRSLANDGLSSALLVVYLDSAQNLPVRRHDEAEALERRLIPPS